MSEFDFKFTNDQLAQLINNNRHPTEWYTALCDMLPKYQITSKIRVAQFIAQTGHESNDFTAYVENLNYSAQGLANTWPNRYAITDSTGTAIKPYAPNDKANSISRQPEKIANATYANRMGNGDESSGDGWAHCGRGLIQLTGAANYQLFAFSVEMPITAVTAYLGTQLGAVESACWFWKNNDLNRWSDLGDTTRVTKIINGGTNGLADRLARYNKALVVLGA
jgi:putative chitinase